MKISITTDEAWDIIDNLDFDNPVQERSSKWGTQQLYLFRRDHRTYGFWIESIPQEGLQIGVDDIQCYEYEAFTTISYRVKKD